MKIKVDKNLLDYSTWASGQTGTVPDPMVDGTTFIEYTTNGGLNYRTTDIDPFGNNAVVWATSGTTTGVTYRCGWNNSNFINNMIPCDNTKSYRFSVWMKRKVISTAGLYYLGFMIYENSGRTTTQNAFNVVDNSQAVAPYFLTGTYANLATILPENVWGLVTGFLRPYNWTGTTNSDDSGIYTGGTKAVSTIDWKFNTGITCTYFKHKVLGVYNGDIAAVGQFIYPRIDLIDGTEPSIATLLVGEGPWRDVDAVKIKLEGLWRDVISAQINIGDVWKTITGTTF